MALLRTLDILCLRTFLQIVETGSFTRAAVAVNRTQPAVSMQIRRLEADVGGALFQREEGRIALTARGARLLPYARSLVSVNDETLTQVGDFDLTGRVRLGVSDDFAEGPMAGIFDRFREAHGKVDIELTVALTMTLVDLLMQGKLDLVVAKRPDTPPPCRFYPLLRSELVWIGSQQYNVEPHAPLPVVMFPEGAFPRKAVLDCLSDASISWNIRATCHSLASLRAVVAAGVGVSAIAESASTALVKVLSDPWLPRLPPVETGLFERSGTGGEAQRVLKRAILSVKQGTG